LIIVAGKLEWSSYLGGEGVDIGEGIHVDSKGNMFIVGDTTSKEFPLIAPFQVKIQFKYKLTVTVTTEGTL
jgi:hypothetical protein